MKKFAIVYGSCETELQKRAVEELTKILLDYTFEYPVCFAYDEAADLSAFKCIYIGTKASNPYIRNASKETLTRCEEYFLRVENSTVTIEGYDDAGVLYGVLDFYNKYIVEFEHANRTRYWVNFLVEDELPDYTYTSAPSVRERGVWTWGHVIYDYRGYFDNMMKLKMNSVVIWNDYAPMNADEMVKYAHARNIRVIWGFSWLWNNFGTIDLSKLDGASEEIVAKYEREYASVGGDGIYFQTFTEFRGDNMGGVLIAEAAANFVNKTAGMLYEKHPNLEIQFGIHSSAVKNHLQFIQTVDPRIRIVWENCGCFPFAHFPTNTQYFGETVEFLEKVAALRGENEQFGVVTKGLVQLDWFNFEHLQGPQCYGVSSDYMKRNRVENKRRVWKSTQAGWLAYADVAYDLIKEMCRMKKGDFCALGLVEDGVFEETVMYPVALYAEMLWNCNSDAKTLIREVSLRDYVCFA